MKLEIWSDVMCPFCYIGKRHLERALAELDFANEIKIEWKSYQLNPEYQNTTGENIYTYLSESKGMLVQQIHQLTAQVTEMAKATGIDINFDTNIPANSFDAHRLLHLAAKYQKQNQAEELLFKAHFTDGKDVAKAEVLRELGKELNLPETEINELFAGDRFADEVKYDIHESKQLGIRGVPFFLMNRKYALSGAQPIAAFKDALKQSFNEWENDQKTATIKSLNQHPDTMCDDEGCRI